jgi:hypothetical protein
VLGGNFSGRADAGGTASDGSVDVAIDLSSEPTDATRADLHTAGKLASGFQAIDLAAAEPDAVSCEFGEDKNFRHGVIL